jgi:hypothetical protein
MGEILPRHTCSRTVWGAAPIRTARLWIGAVPVIEEDRPLAHLRQLAAPLNPQAGALHPRVELDRGRFWMAN